MTNKKSTELSLLEKSPPKKDEVWRNYSFEDLPELNDAQIAFIKEKALSREQWLKLRRQRKKKR